MPSRILFRVLMGGVAFLSRGRSMRAVAEVDGVGDEAHDGGGEAVLAARAEADGEDADADQPGAAEHAGEAQPDRGAHVGAARAAVEHRLEHAGQDPQRGAGDVAEDGQAGQRDERRGEHDQGHVQVADGGKRIGASEGAGGHGEGLGGRRGAPPYTPNARRRAPGDAACTNRGTTRVAAPV